MNRKLSSLLLLLLTVLGSTYTHAQLAGGTYTINSAAATGGTNYASFTAAISAMSLGITGPVVFNVVAGSGPYTEQVTIGNITGASAANTIKFNGNGATVQYSASATYNGVLMMNGAKFVKFDSLTFKGLNATYGTGAILYNACANDSITRCTFDLTALTSTASTNFGIRIASTASSTSTTASGATDTYIGGNTIAGAVGSGGPYYGFYSYGPSTNNVYNNNYVSNFYLYGMYVAYAADVTSQDNIITRETKTSVAYCYGFYLYYSKGGCKVIGNRVRSLGGATAGTTYCYPLYIYYSTGTAAKPILVSNNVVYNMTLAATYGIRLYYSDYINLYSNTVSMDVPVNYSSTVYGINAYAGDYCNVKNNNVSITGGGTGTKYGNYFYSNTNHTSDYNNIYVNSTQSGSQFYGYLTSDFATLAAFQTANPTFEANGRNANPQFVAPATGNFTPGNTALIGAGQNLSTLVPTDINGQPRANAPTIGAFEAGPSGTNNASIASTLVGPSGNFCTGAQPVKVTVNNAGGNNITSLQINWTVNNVAQTPYSYTGTLVPITASSGQSSAVVTIGNATLTAGANTIKVWTSLPNNTADSDPANDTMSATLTPTTFSVTATLDTICGSGVSTIKLSPTTGYSTGALQWQSSPDGVTWNNIANSDAATFDATGISAATRYRAVILTGGTNCYSPVKLINVRDVNVLTTVPATRCGIGTVTLGATGTPGATVKWYDAPTGGTAIGTGTSFTTPSISATTTYYATASTGNAGNTAVGPLNPAALGAGGYSTLGTYKVYFTVTSAVTIASVDVFSNAGGVSTGIRIQTEPGLVSVADVPYTTVAAASLSSGQTVPLNVLVQPGTYSMISYGTIPSLYRNTAGASYPYSTPELSITGHNFSGYPQYHYFFYNWQIAGGCESARTPVVATVGAAPAITAAATPSTVCAGSTATISVSSANTNYAYSWSSGQTTNSFSATPAATTKYVVNAVDATTNCAAKDSVTVTVVTQTATITPSATQTICIGNSVTLSANTGTGLSYQWFNSNGPIAGATNATYAANAAGTYTVRVTNSSTTCSAMSSGVTVNVVSAPAATVSPAGAVALCTGDSVTLQGPTGSGYTYQWKNGTSNATGTSTNATYKTGAAGTYTLVVSANGCSTTSSVTTVSLVPLPVALISPSAATTACDSIVFSSATTGVTYQWNYNGIPVLGATAQNYRANASGPYTVKVTSTTTGCSATSAAVTATVNQSPAGVISYSSPLSFCEGGAVVLNTYEATNNRYQWVRNNADIPGATTAHYIVRDSGLYSLIVEDIVTGCAKVSNPVLVRIFPTPTATIVYNPQTNTLSTAEPFVQFQWQLNNQPVVNATQATYVPAESGAYAVIVTDSNGCKTTSSVRFVNNVGVVNTIVGASLRIYPNPTTGLLHVTATEKVFIAVKDITGKQIFKGNSTEAIDLRSFADGFYLLTVTDNEGRMIRAEKITKSGL